VRIVVAGGAGMLGRDLAPLLEAHPGGHAVRVLDRNDADLAEPAAVERALAGFAPELIYDLAAMTDVDGCELDPVQAERDNATAAATLAETAARHGAHLVYLSTDYVFDGTATAPIPPAAPVNPLSVYGRTKLAGERAVQAVSPRWLVVRTAWLVGVHGRNFVEAVRERARRGLPLEVVDDQRGTPTFTFDLAPALVTLGLGGHGGVLHVTNQGECSRFEQAAEILRLEGLRVPLTAVKSDRHPRPARRPAYSVLDNAAANAILGAPLPPWRESLARYLEMRPAPAA
jgi:dTDP-4-dehydrorhamnose reductase